MTEAQVLIEACTPPARRRSPKKGAKGLCVVAGRGHSVPANFFVFYEIDEDESKHALSLEKLGHQEVANAWVLLEKVDA